MEVLSTPNQTDLSPEFRLVQAAEHGHLKIVQAMVDTAPLDILVKAMNDAIRHRQIEIIRFLCDFFSDSGISLSLYLAAKIGDQEIVQFLIERGVNDFENGMTGAIEGDHLSLVKLFVEQHKAKANAENLEDAVWTNKKEIVSYLLRHSDFDQDELNMALLFIRNIEMAQILIDHGANNIQELISELIDENADRALINFLVNQSKKF